MSINPEMPMDARCCGRQETVSSRREFLLRSGFGFGALALGYLLSSESSLGSILAHRGAGSGYNPLAAKLPHFAPKARSVIFLFMKGGPSHIDTFDPKPELNRLDGQLLPPSFQSEDLGLQFVTASQSKLMGSRRTFKRYGKSGLQISDLFENVAQYADDLAVIRSCYHDSFIHGPAMSILNTGSIRLGHPSMGSWVVYGLGSETENLPAFVVISQHSYVSTKALYGSGFLPAAYQGTFIRNEGPPLRDLSPVSQIQPRNQRRILDELRNWNRRHAQDRRSDDSRLWARMASYELAFRMQAAAPELVDLSKEPEYIRKMYGLDQEPTDKFARVCLLARRMVERGVRFVQLYSGGWDTHSQNDKNTADSARNVDKPIGALLGDLKQRGLLESTLVVWTGEFGRTPIVQGNLGRDHNPYGFTTWMAGGGIQGGKVIGATDELGFRAVEDKIHVNDLHATMLSLLGLDHEKLTFFFQGRDQRLTDVGGDNDLASRLI